MLSDEEQRLFRGLAVFAGGCTLEAAEAVCDADLDTLQSLVEKSLLRFSNERYWMLETIKRYASERLDTLGEATDHELRHARYYLAQLEARQPLIFGARRGDLLEWFDAEADNYRAALDRLESAAPGDAARAADLLTSFWIPRGQLTEGRERLRALLARDDLRGEVRAVLLEHLSDHDKRLGAFDSAVAAAQEAVSLAQEAGDRRTVAYALRHLGFIAIYRGDMDEATRVSTRVLEEAGYDEELRSLALGDLAIIDMEAGRDEEARRKLRASSDGFHAVGDEANEAIANINLACLELYSGDFEAARAVASSVLVKNRSIGDHYRGIGALNALGFANLGLGRHSEARDAFAESLDLVLASGMTGHEVLTETLTGIALAAVPEEFRSAARLRGAVDRLDSDGGFDSSARWREFYNTFEGPLLEALGDEAYTSERAIGAGMNVDDAIELARSLVAA